MYQQVIIHFRPSIILVDLCSLENLLQGYIISTYRIMALVTCTIINLWKNDLCCTLALWSLATILLGYKLTWDVYELSQVKEIIYQYGEVRNYCQSFGEKRKHTHTANTNLVKPKYKKPKSPSFWASLITWSANVVLPDALHPYISTILPWRGSHIKVRVFHF